MSRWDRWDWVACVAMGTLQASVIPPLVSIFMGSPRLPPIEMVCMFAIGSGLMFCYCLKKHDTIFIYANGIGTVADLFILWSLITW